MTKQRAQEIINKIQNGKATDEEKALAKEAFKVLTSSIFSILFTKNIK